MALDHRIPAIFTAIFSSVGVLLAAFSGASCNFLVRISEEGEESIIIDSELDGDNASFGILCEHDIFPRDGDRMWELSRIFLILGLSLGSLTAALAWSVASFLTPTDSNWSGISILAAITAVIQVPAFVLFEAEPCLGDLEDIDLFSNITTGLGCKLGPGSYVLIASDLFFISVTVLTQCFDRPRWGLDLDIWKVHKKGESNKTKKKNPNATASKRSRKDEYYYDDNENYDDDVHLTSRRARSIVGSDGADEKDFYTISRILPAGKAKQSESKETNEAKNKPVGFFAKLFGPFSPVDGMEVPVGETKSMSGDDDYDYEHQLLHNLEVVRVLPLIEGQRASTPTGSGEGEEVSIDAFDDVLKTETKAATDRSFESFEPVVEDGTELIPWMPSAGTHSGITANVVVQHQMIDSPNASLISCMESTVPEKPVVSSVNDILQDLQCEENAARPYHPKPGACPGLVPQEQESRDSVTTFTPVSDTAVIQGARKPTTNHKPADSKKRQGLSSFNIFKSRKGSYCQMSSDQSSDDVDDDEDSKDNYFNYYNETDVKPPPALQLLYSSEDVNRSVMSEGESEIKHIYDELNEDGYEENSLVQSTQTTTPGGKATPFDCISIGSTHSDPGPMSFSTNEGSSNFTSFTSGSAESSEESTASFTGLFKVHADDDMLWDNDFSTESISQTTDDDDNDENYNSQDPSRGRPLGRNDGRRRRRPISPVGSIKSHCSVLHMTIDEETEEDVKNELENNAYAPYSIKRTLSSPEMRSVVGPISTRREKSTNELLKRLKQLKHTIKVDSENSWSDLPPRTPPKDSTNTNTDGPPVVSMDEISTVGSKVDDSSAILSELLRPDRGDANMDGPADRSNDYSSSVVPSEPRYSANNTSIDSWKELLSPMKDNTPSKEQQHWKKPGSLGTPSTMDISDETSDTGHTHSTISYDSDDDDSSEGGHESGPRQIRSKSVGRTAKKHKNKINVYRTSNSLSPTTRRKKATTSLAARESRIRRLQQLRKGYLPLDNHHDARAESPEPYHRDPYGPLSDPELTPKRKTVTAVFALNNNDRDEIMSAASSSDLPDGLFQPSLLEINPDQPCPEFDNILDHLDLQLIDLNRPIGAEYGDDEGSM